MKKTKQCFSINKMNFILNKSLHLKCVKTLWPPYIFFFHWKIEPKSPCRAPRFKMCEGGMIALHFFTSTEKWSQKSHIHTTTTYLYIWLKRMINRFQPISKEFILSFQWIFTISWKLLVKFFCTDENSVNILHFVFKAFGNSN